MTPRIRHAALTAAVVLAFSVFSALADDGPAEADPFPELEALRGNVDFWVRVFGEWSLSRVAIHDLEYPGIIYEVVDLPGPIEERYTKAQRQFIEEVRESWKGYLHALERKIAGGRQLDEFDEQWLAHIEERVGAHAIPGAHQRVRSQRGLRERFRDGIERSHRYDGLIRQIFRRAGLPEDLAYLPHVESSFQYHARSSAGATGLWQFTRSTGKQYMLINSAIDERLDPISATRGAAKYLREAYDRLGTWPLALTSYNYGVHGMLRAKERFGTDFERIYREHDGRTFGFASKNFYTEFLAARIVAGNSDGYFPEGHDPEPAFDFDQLVLDRRTTVRTIAKTYGIPVSELAAINPAWSSRAVHKGLALPAGALTWLPRGTRRDAEPVADLLSDEDLQGRIDEDGHYIVREGDTLSDIAASQGMSAETLRRLNGISGRSSLIRVGQRLRLTPDPSGGEHVVRRGDTLVHIASIYGVRMGELLSANMLTVNSIIRPGQTLRIPR